MKRLASKFRLPLLGAMAAVAIVASIASADDVHNDLSNSSNGGPNQATTGTNFPVRFWLVAQPNDGGTGAGNCNASEASPAVVTVDLPADSGLSVSPTALNITRCGKTQPAFVMNICPTKAGVFSRNDDTNLKVHVTDDDGSTYNILNADIELTVTDPPEGTQPGDCSTGGGGDPPANRAPVVGTSAQDASDTEGKTLQSSGSFSDPDGDSLSITAKLSNGDPLPSGMTFTDAGDGTWSWSFPTDDNFSGTIDVTASDGVLTATDSFDYTSTNVNPNITNLTVSTSGVGESVCQPSVSFGIDDPGTADTWAHYVDFNSAALPDVTALLAAVPATLTSTNPRSVAKTTPYPTTGTKTIAVAVKDDDGGTDTDTITHEVPNVVTNPNNVQFGPPLVLTGNGKGLFNSGSTIPVKLRASACGFASDGSFTPVTGLALKVSRLIYNSPSIGQATLQATSNVKGDAGGWMRESANQYIYNLATPKTAVTGSYTLVIEEWTAKTGGSWVRDYAQPLAFKR